MKNKKSKIILLLFIILGLALPIGYYPTDNNLHIIFCNVGQGDGILIVTPQGKQLLIDAGPDQSIENCLTKHIPFYDHTIELSAISHMHADHITGFIKLFNSYNSGIILKNELTYPTPEHQALSDQIAKMQNTYPNTQVHQVWTGDKIKIEQDLSIQVFWPKPNLWNTANGNWEAYLSDLNDSSFIFLVTFHKTAILLTGDVGKDILTSISRTNEFKSSLANTTYRVLKGSHHGSQDAISEELLKVYHPNDAVISVGNNNKFGHPHALTLELLKKYKTNILRTDTSGEIEVITNGQQHQVKVQYQSNMHP